MAETPPPKQKREIQPKTEQVWTSNEKLTFALATLAFAGNAIITSVSYSRGDIGVVMMSVLLLSAVIGLGALVGAWHFKKNAFIALLGAIGVSIVGFIIVGDWLNVAIHVFLGAMTYGTMALSLSVLE